MPRADWPDCERAARRLAALEPISLLPGDYLLECGGLSKRLTIQSREETILVRAQTEEVR
jgi:hypothetical protein